MNTATNQHKHTSYKALEARHAALNHLYINIAFIAANCDGAANDFEIKAITKEFPFFENKPEFLQTINYNSEYLYFCCKQILKFSSENSKTSKNLFLKIFKIIIADGAIRAPEIELLEKLSKYLKIADDILASVFEVYFTPPAYLKSKKPNKTLIKNLISGLHPDKFYSLNLLDQNLKLKILHLANNRLQILNAYNTKKLT